MLMNYHIVILIFIIQLIFIFFYIFLQKFILFLIDLINLNNFCLIHHQQNFHHNHLDTYFLFFFLIFFFILEDFLLLEFLIIKIIRFHLFLMIDFKNFLIYLSFLFYFLNLLGFNFLFVQNSLNFTLMSHINLVPN